MSPPQTCMLLRLVVGEFFRPSLHTEDLDNFHDLETVRKKPSLERIIGKVCVVCQIK